MASVSTPDGALHLTDQGSGPAVVFVHGTPSSSDEFRGVIASLRGEARCVALDHLGFGRSAKPPGADYSVAAHQARFATAMRALALDGAVLVLHDFGAAIALPWMLAHPGRVRGVLLTNTFLWGVDGPLRWMLRPYATAPGRWLYRATNLSARYLLPWAWGRHRPLDAETHARYLAPFPRARDRHATAALPAELIGPTLGALSGHAGALARWPVRAVWGMADPLVGAAALERWRSVLPHLPVDEVTDAGHFVADEAPDRVAAAVTALLAEATPWDRSQQPA